MPLPATIKSKAVQVLTVYCQNKVPIHAQDQVQVDFKMRGNNATLIEKRRPFRRTSLDMETWIEIVVAQFRYDQASKKWALYYADRNSKWHRYPNNKPSVHLKTLLQAVDDDPTGIFWG